MATQVALGTQPPWSSTSFVHHPHHAMGPSPPPQSQFHQHNISALSNPYYNTAYNLQPKNHVDLSRDRLITVLNHFSHLLAGAFNNRPFRLVVHGGACMLLHPGVYALSLEQQHYLPQLPHRNKTRDVDIIHRSFVTEMAQIGVPNAAEKLKQCILATAQHFNLGADWMNSDADIALPMATAPNGMSYDPIYNAAVQPNNIELHTIYRSPNGMLTLISVTPFWAVSLKLVRYSPQDAADICLLLRNGTKLSQTNWTADILREWLFMNCWPMGYAHYDRIRLRNINQRIEHALQTLNEWSTNEKAHPIYSFKSAADSAFTSVNVAPTPMANRITPLAAMGGGGEIVGGENATEGGWKPSWPSASGPWHPESKQMERRRRSQSHSANPSPPSRVMSPVEVESRNELGAAYGMPGPSYHDPSDFGLIPQSQDSVAKKAKKKSKKNKNLSTSAPSTFMSPPPPYPGPAAPIYGSPYNNQYLGQPTDKETTGLASLRDLERNLEQDVGQMLHGGPPPAVGAPAWRRPEKLKKSKSKDKRKREKERARKQERERSRLQKWTSPWEYPPPPAPLDALGGSSEEDSDEDYGSSDDTDDDVVNVHNTEYHRNSWVAHASQYPQRSPPNPSGQSWSHASQQPAPGSSPQSQPYSHPPQSSQAPFAPLTHATHRPSQSYYAPPTHSSQPPLINPQPPQLTTKPHKRSPLSLSPTWNASTYPGMQVSGPAPTMSMPTIPSQFQPPIPHHGYYSNPLSMEAQNTNIASSSKPTSQNTSSSLLGLTLGHPAQLKEKEPEPFIPPADIYNDYPPPPRGLY